MPNQRVLRTLLLLLIAGSAAASATDDCAAARDPKPPFWASDFSEYSGAADPDTDWIELRAAFDQQVDCSAIIALLQARTKRPDTALVATAWLMEIGQRPASDLIAVIRNSTQPDDVRADLLRVTTGLMGQRKETLSPAKANHLVSWASIGSAKLARAAQELRAVQQDPVAVLERGQRLLSCADEPKGAAGDCMGWHEYGTAQLPIIERLWTHANTAQRSWLARWSASRDANQQFFAKEILRSDPATQHQIMAGPLGAGGETPVHAIHAALALLEQALADPTQRPARLEIDFAKDDREGLFGIRVYQQQGYPSALQLAFEELRTYPDAHSIMRGLVALDHPWLATHAGLWLLQHGNADDARDALRFTLGADGVPSQHILGRLADALEPSSPIIAELVWRAVSDGHAGKWQVFANDRFEALLFSPKLRAALIQRVAQLPANAAAAGLDTTSDDGLRKRMNESRALREEMQAIDWFARTLYKREDKLPDEMVVPLSTQPVEIWQSFAMTFWFQTGDPRAMNLAAALAESASPMIRKQAVSLVDGTKKPKSQSKAD
jgi:hypothetical protein